MRKKVLSVILTLAMVLSLMPAAWAQEAEVKGLPEAVDGVVTLTANTDISTTGWKVTGDIMLDLAGYQLKAANTREGHIEIWDSASLTLMDSVGGGKVYTETDYEGVATGYGLIDVIGGTFIMEGGSIEAVRKDPANRGQFAIGIELGGTVIINGGKIESGWYAISGNGQDDAKTSTVEVNGGELISVADYALYLPHSGETTIRGGVVYGAAGGVSIQRGTLNISDNAVITSKGTGDTGNWGDGTGGQEAAAVNIAAKYGDCTVNISGGELSAEEKALIIKADSAHKIDFTITGGTFSSDVSAYLDENYTVVNDGGSFKVEPLTHDNAAAQVGDQYYATLKGAITAAQAGETVTLLKDIDLGSGYINIEKKLTLDLNGCTITGRNTWVIGVYNDVTIKDSSNGRGKIVNSATSGKTIIAVLAQEKSQNDRICKLTIEGGVITATGIENSYGVFSNNSTTTYGPTIIVNGGEITGNFAGLTVTHDTDLTISGGEITGNYYAVSGNGTADDTNITINGGKLISKKGNAVYHPQVGNMTIGGNAELTGPNGIQYCGAGTLTIQDNAVITATGPHTEFPSKPSDQGDGSTDDGAALSIVSRGSGYQDGDQKMTVNITGGTLTSVNNAAISVYRLKQNADKNWITNDQTNLDSYLAELNITGGRLSGDEHKGVFEIDGAAKETVIVSGGHFSEPVEVEYLNDSLNAELKSDSEPKTPYSYYISMNDAIAAAKPGDSITEVNVTEGANMYTVTLNYAAGNTGDSVYKVAANTTITLPTPTRSGYTFDGWYNGGTKVSNPYTVTGNVTLVARWNPIDQGGSYEPSTPVGDYLVSVDKTTGGKVTVNPGRADKGDTVTITVKPDKGYELDELTVTAKNGDTVKLTEKSNGKFTFKMPDSKVTVEAVFVKENSEQPVVTLPFADVNKGDWFYDAVAYVYGNDLMNGTSATAFSPYLTTSRAMMLTMLARYDGVDTTTGSTWYEAGAVWAVAEGISDGTNLEADLTREQLVTMLWRYTGSPVVESDLSAYPDGGAVSDWAVNAMIWATQTGVITGNGAGALAPQGTATRAEVATILARFCAGK